MPAKNRDAPRPMDYGLLHGPQNAAALPATGYLRLNKIIGSTKTNPPTPPLIPVSRSTWYAGIKSGRFPAPTKPFGGRISLYRVEAIRDLIAQMAFDADKADEAIGRTQKQQCGEIVDALKSGGKPSAKVIVSKTTQPQSFAADDHYG